MQGLTALMPPLVFLMGSWMLTKHSQREMRRRWRPQVHNLLVKPSSVTRPFVLAIVPLPNPDASSFRIATTRFAGREDADAAAGPLDGVVGAGEGYAEGSAAGVAPYAGAPARSAVGPIFFTHPLISGHIRLPES